MVWFLLTSVQNKLILESGWINVKLNADAIEHIENDAIALREKSSAVVLGIKVIRIGFEHRSEVKVTPENPDHF
jgi:hypothetical protein